MYASLQFSEAQLAFRFYPVVPALPILPNNPNRLDLNEKKFLPRMLDLLRQRAAQLRATWMPRMARLFANLYAYLMRQPPLRRGTLMLVLAGAICGALLFLYILILIPTTPSIKDLQQARTAQASTI